MSFNTIGPPHGPVTRKVAIPRLQRPSHAKPSQDRRRVSRACTACRAHKIKCTGDVPQCKHCETTGRDCIYILPRKDRLKSVTERCMQMAGLLKKLRPFADQDDSARIGDLLDATEQDSADAHHIPTLSNPDTNDDDSRSEPHLDPRTQDPTHHMDTDLLDLLDENLHENDQSRATGFVGQNSEVQWLRTFLLLERADDETAPLKHFPSTASNHEQVSAVTYYLDHERIEPDFQVDPYGLPAHDVADQLLSLYMDKVHDSFPILPRRVFEDQCRKYFGALRHGTAPRLNTKWQAILNLVFAIGAKYSHLVKPTWEADARDHLVYRARACALGWNESSLEQHPDLPQIQVAGLLALYYLSVGQVSRAWTVIGIAVRFAVALGLHVRNEDRSASGSKREVLIRVWWSLSHLERQISVMIGRPSAIDELDCSVPLPAPYSEQQILEDINLVNNLRRSSLAPTASPTALIHPLLGPRSLSQADFADASARSVAPEANSGSYFRATVELTTIMQGILKSLYTAGTRIRSPDELQQGILQLGQRLDDWVVKLPFEFSFHTHRPAWSASQTPFHRERTLLTFQFCSAKILLTRPCLSSLRGVGEKATTTTDFFRRMADICVNSAKAVVDALPDQPQPRFLYEFGPWWTAVHNLTQASAVFLLTLSYTSGASQDSLSLATYCRKIISWLHSIDDSLAERAYRVVLSCFEIVAKRLSLPPFEEPYCEHQLPLPSMEQHFDLQLGHPGLLAPVSQVAFGFAENPSVSTTFSPYDPLTSAGAYVPPPDGSIFHQRNF